MREKVEVDRIVAAGDFVRHFRLPIAAGRLSNVPSPFPLERVSRWSPIKSKTSAIEFDTRTIVAQSVLFNEMNDGREGKTFFRYGLIRWTSDFTYQNGGHRDTKIFMKIMIIFFFNRSYVFLRVKRILKIYFFFIKTTILYVIMFLN